MNVGIFGTGIVGRTIAAKLTELGHRVLMGTRDVAETLRRTTPTAGGSPPFSAWQETHPQVHLATFADAAARSEILVNATSGEASLKVLASAGEQNLEKKILIDISNPLDFSKGMPPTLTICNTDSLGERIQRELPALKVVKTLNTVNALIMVNPGLVNGGDHHVFISGNDGEAKVKVTGLLKEWFGWKHVMDLGDITTARGTEMYLPLWIRMWGGLQTPMFNIKVVR